MLILRKIITKRTAHGKQKCNIFPCKIGQLSKNTFHEAIKCYELDEIVKSFADCGRIIHDSSEFGLSQVF